MPVASKKTESGETPEVRAGRVCAGGRVMCTLGAGGAVTVIVTPSEILPPVPVQVIV